jgi:hypothetical protein
LLVVKRIHIELCSAYPLQLQGLFSLVHRP